MWRWDQGRLLYFQFEILKRIAKVLVNFDGVDISKCESLFRETLVQQTGMPFSPERYTVKRNYSRVFQCSFLASFSGNYLITTDICRDLANDDENSRIECVDDYLWHYVRKFRFPFPAFDGYNTTEQRVYPFCAILKFLIAQRELGKEAKISLDSILENIVGNRCTGEEDIAYYKTLVPASYSYPEAEKRQLREMVLFLSQLSILKVYNGYLYLEDIIENELKDFLQPEIRLAQTERLSEFLEMATLDSERTNFIASILDNLKITPIDYEFIEGNRKRVEHFRVERSRLLRKYYMQLYPKPICSACGIKMEIKYPWTDYMLDIHHLLPLGSTVALSARGTSLSDIVGLCPSCHQAIHIYYRKWLKNKSQADFVSKQQARDVYMQATREIVL